MAWLMAYWLTSLPGLPGLPYQLIPAYLSYHHYWWYSPRMHLMYAPINTTWWYGNGHNQTSNNLAQSSPDVLMAQLAIQAIQQCTMQPITNLAIQRQSMAIWQSSNPAWASNPAIWQSSRRQSVAIAQLCVNNKK